MQDEESTEVTIVTQEMVYAQDKAAADIQVSTAHAYPRNVTKATTNAIAIVTIDQETAETCTYALKRGGKVISGPSVHLAKVLAQTWGNLRVDAKVVAIDATHVTSESVCWDLETNVAIKVQVKRSIVQNEYVGGQKSGKMIRMNEDMITVTGNAANSIALRNAVLSVVPRGVVDKVYKEAKKAITGDLSDATKLIQRRAGAVKRFKDMYGVDEKEILALLGKNSIDLLDADDIVVLVGVDSALKSGDTTVEMAFNRAKPGASNAGSSSNDQKLFNRFKDAIAACKTELELTGLEARMKKDFPDLQADYDKKLGELLDQKAASEAK